MFGTTPERSTMLRKVISYKNYNDQLVEKEFHFHLSKIELAEMDIMTPGGYAEKLKIISNTGEGHLIYPLLKEIILSAVGERSEDGNEFLKNDKIRDSFVRSPAYEVFIFELLNDADYASKFMTEILPKELRDKVLSGSGVLEQSETSAEKPKTLEDYSLTELTNLPYNEFEALVAAALPNIPKEVLVLAFQRKTAKAR